MNVSATEVCIIAKMTFKNACVLLIGTPFHSVVSYSLLFCALHQCGLLTRP
jgi:hypothetical protein